MLLTAWSVQHPIHKFFGLRPQNHHSSFRQRQGARNAKDEPMLFSAKFVSLASSLT